MKPTLVIMAAGLGSRYGGLKQLDRLGPAGESIMDYSVFDAIRAGFGKVVFVIRHAFAEQFAEQVLQKYQGIVETAVVYQEIDSLPIGFHSPAERTKPWGTNHALMMAAPEIKGPFAVINADDFYGREAFQIMSNYLSQLPIGSRGAYCMVAYDIQSTLTAEGSVSRGVCKASPEGYLMHITEHKNIHETESKEIVSIHDGKKLSIARGTLVSMNLWGFTPDYLEYSNTLFIDFLKEHANEPASEFFIPTVVDTLIRQGLAQVQVLRTDARWFGATYVSDRDMVIAHLSQLTRAGEYPTPLL